MTKTKSFKQILDYTAWKTQSSALAVTTSSSAGCKRSAADGRILLPLPQKRRMALVVILRFV